MTENVNNIPTLQNEEPALKLLRARTHIYSCATWIMVLQLLLTVIFPVAGAVLAIVWPGVGAYVAAASLVIVIADPWIIDPSYKLRLKRAAKISEQFDCMVLDLPWDQFTVGDKVDEEDIHTAARSYANRHDDTNLRDWYPKNVGAAPLHLARIICQRSNLRYDSKLRRTYGSIIWITAALIVAGLFLSALLQNLSLADWVLRMTPATPVLAWAVREYYRQRDTAELLEDLMKEARELWANALSGKCDDMDCCHKSRQFQNAIYTRRASSPLVMPFLYRLKRSFLEDEMNVGAADFLRELDIPSTSGSSSDTAAARPK
jgi:hypothetical protein